AASSHAVRHPAGHTSLWQRRLRRTAFHPATDAGLRRFRSPSEAVRRADHERAEYLVTGGRDRAWVYLTPNPLSASQRGEAEYDDYRVAKYWWTNCTAMDPSPTAEATRFTERARTSPATKTPGTLVSSKKGSRSSVQPFGRRPSIIKSGPERMKPFLSRSTTPASHSVRGAAPMKMNRAVAGAVFVSPVSVLLRVIASRLFSPCASNT